MLRLAAVDEAHIHAMHGRSFRQSIGVLSDTLFEFLFGDDATVSPLFLAMTVTMPMNLLAAFSALTHVDFCSTDHQIWASAAEFQQRNVSIDLHVRGRGATISNSVFWHRSWACCVMTWTLTYFCL